MRRKTKGKKRKREGQQADKLTGTCRRYKSTSEITRYFIRKCTASSKGFEGRAGTDPVSKQGLAWANKGPNRTNQIKEKAKNV